MSNREEWVSQLRTNICEVTFTKVNGDNRVMTCTLREDLVPPVASHADDSGVQRHSMSSVCGILQLLAGDHSELITSATL